MHGANRSTRQRGLHHLRICDTRTCLEDLPIRFKDIVSAITEGRITPREGESLSNILTSHAQTMERVEFDRRIKELEDQIPEMDAYRREVRMQLKNSERVNGPKK